MSQLETYYKNIKKPWGILFYQTLWQQLSFLTGKRILDFGSGFGITANHLAKNNEVIAIEPNKEMCLMREQDYPYEQINGGMEQLDKFSDGYFDVVIVHNVLEYVDNQEMYCNALFRVLKKTGILSIVKHNKTGRIMQRVIFENNLELALQELEGMPSSAQNFGIIQYYNQEDIVRWLKPNVIKIDHLFGIRVFFGLVQNNEIKYDEAWQKQILELELKTSTMEEFKKIAFFHHIILEKK